VTSYAVSVESVEPRPIAAVRGRMSILEVPARFRSFLDRVYSVAKANAIALDGQNIFVYRGDPSDIVDIDFGVGAKSEFSTADGISYTHVPGGEVATTTHWGDYAKLGDAYTALLTWCRANNRTTAGVWWEVYGHWSDDPAKRRTDIFFLLRRTG